MDNRISTYQIMISKKTIIPFIIIKITISYFFNLFLNDNFVRNLRATFNINFSNKKLTI